MTNKINKTRVWSDLPTYPNIECLEMGECYIFRNFHVIILDQTVTFRRHAFVLLTCSNKYSLPESMSVYYKITSYHSPYCVSLVDIKIMTRLFVSLHYFVTRPLVTTLTLIKARNETVINIGESISSTVA